MTVEREGRFRDSAPGSGVLGGLRSSTEQDPFNKAFIARNMKQYKVLKKGGLGTKKGLKKLRKIDDTQLEALMAKAVLKKHGHKPKKLPTKFNTKKFNIKRAKAVMAKRAAGETVKKQYLRQTRAARLHITRIRANRVTMGTPVYRNVPPGF